MVKRGVTIVSFVLSIPVMAGAQPATIEYYHVDAIGSVRAVTDKTGATVRRHDYFPFGEEYQTQPGADALRFTGKERDAETGLDYFSARYHGQRVGRFTSVDPGHVGGNIFDPQSWNAYAYARNNPLLFVDPTGTAYFINVFGGGSFWVDNDNDLPLYREGGFSFRGGNIFNAEGKWVGTYEHFSPFDRILIDAGNRAEPGVNLAAGALAGFGAIVAPIPMAIAGCVAAGSDCSAAGTAMAVTPLRPFGMSNAAFGKVIGWTRGGTLAANLARTQALIRQLPGRIPALRQAGVTADMAREWAQFYRAEAARNPANPNALPRAQLMEAIANLLGQ